MFLFAFLVFIRNVKYRNCRYSLLLYCVFVLFVDYLFKTKFICESIIRKCVIFHNIIYYTVVLANCIERARHYSNLSQNRKLKHTLDASMHHNILHQIKLRDGFQFPLSASTMRFRGARANPSEARVRPVSKRFSSRTRPASSITEFIAGACPPYHFFEYSKSVSEC